MKTLAVALLLVVAGCASPTPSFYACRGTNLKKPVSVFGRTEAPVLVADAPAYNALPAFVEVRRNDGKSSLSPLRNPQGDGRWFGFGFPGPGHYTAILFVDGKEQETTTFTIKDR